MAKYFASLLLFLVVWPSFAADQNGYTAKYEVRAGNTTDSITNFDLAAEVTHACDVTITTADSAATITSKLTNNQYICVDKGNYASMGTWTIPNSGTSGARKVLRYTRSGDTDDEPWNQTSENQAKILGITCLNKSYWIFHRLSILPTSGARVRFENCDFSIMDRTLIDGTNVNNANGLILFAGASGPNDQNTVQNSVIRNSGKVTNTDVHCINLRGIDNRIVNNEIYNCGGDGIVMDDGGNPFKNKIENNDIYQTSAYLIGCDGSPGTDCNCGEDGIDLKSNNTTDPSNFITILHNRFWGWRTTYETCSGTGSNGFAVNAGALDPKRYVLVQNNIIQDVANGVALGGPASNWSVIGNIFYNIIHGRVPDDGTQNGDGNSIVLRFVGGDNHKAYLNTIIDAEYGLRIESGGENNDMRCNLFINIPHIKLNETATWGAGSKASNNAFYNTPPYSTVASSNSISYPSASDAKGSPYRYFRRLLTNPEQITIPYARTSNDSPHVNACTDPLSIPN